MHQYLQHYQHQQASRDVNDVISRALAAKHEANLACTCDISHKYLEAVEHYDKAIHLIDELLTHIPVGNKAPSSASSDPPSNSVENTVQRLWDEIVHMRQQYNDRMEFIRGKQQEAQSVYQSHISHHTSPHEDHHQDGDRHGAHRHHHQHHHHGGGGGRGGIRGHRNKAPRRMSRVTLDMTSDPASPSTKPWEIPPSVPARHPFWLMRLIRTSILTGGFLTEDLFMPKQVWAQIGVKFYALGSKVSAFEDVMQLLNDRIAPLQYPTDVYAIDHALVVFEHFLRELISIQNSLSKPFPFIAEVPVASAPVVVTAPGTASQVGRLAGLFTAMGRNVVKYAEVGYQRIGSAITPKVSHNEFVRYVARTSEVCDKIQVLDKWIAFVESEKDSLTAEADGLKQRANRSLEDVDSAGVNNDRQRQHDRTSSQPNTTNHSTSSTNSSSTAIGGKVLDESDGEFSLYRHALDASQTSTNTASHDTPTPIIGGVGVIATRHRGPETIRMHFSRLDNLSGLLHRIAAFVQHVLCELLLRDVEYLHCRYLRKMRRSMSRMYWDDEGRGDHDGTSTSGTSGGGGGSNSGVSGSSTYGGASESSSTRTTNSAPFSGQGIADPSRHPPQIPE